MYEGRGECTMYEGVYNVRRWCTMYEGGVQCTKVNNYRRKEIHPTRLRIPMLLTRCGNIAHRTVSIIKLNCFKLIIKINISGFLKDILELTVSRDLF